MVTYFHLVRKLIQSVTWQLLRYWTWKKVVQVCTVNCYVTCTVGSWLIGLIFARSKDIVILSRDERHASAIYTVIMCLSIYPSHASIAWQVYLLTPMDHATLLDAISTISHCLHTEYNYQATSVGRSKIATHTEKCRLLAHIWTIMLKLHLVDLLSI